MSESSYLSSRNDRMSAVVALLDRRVDLATVTWCLNMNMEDIFH